MALYSVCVGFAFFNDHKSHIEINKEEEREAHSIKLNRATRIDILTWTGSMGDP